MPQLHPSFRFHVGALTSASAPGVFFKKGPDHCLDLLSKYYQENIFPKDKQRLINRLAFCLEYNDIMENHYSKKTPITLNPLVIQVVKPKRDLYELAETRFHKMIEAGALDEVKSLHESKKISKTLYKAHGLPELLACIRNKMSLEDAIFDGIQNTKRYIKRQFTWWNNQKFSQLNLRINYKKSQQLRLCLGLRRSAGARQGVCARVCCVLCPNGVHRGKKIAAQKIWIVTLSFSDGDFRPLVTKY